MPFYLFLWPPQVVAHVMENGVTQDEFEEIVCAPGQLDASRTTGPPVAIGITASGRLLVCVYEFLDPETVLPITAFEPDLE